jgi:hypothetical protein
MGQDLVAEGNAQIADVDPRAGDQPDVSLFLAAERAPTVAAIHG